MPSLLQHHCWEIPHEVLWPLCLVAGMILGSFWGRRLLGVFAFSPLGRPEPRGKSLSPFWRLCFLTLAFKFGKFWQSCIICFSFSFLVTPSFIHSSYFPNARCTKIHASLDQIQWTLFFLEELQSQLKVSVQRHHRRIYQSIHTETFIGQLTHTINKLKKKRRRRINLWNPANPAKLFDPESKAYLHFICFWDTWFTIQSYILWACS